MTSLLRDVVRAQQAGEPVGVYSVCSSNRYVLRAAMEQARRDGTPVLIEPTANQVNQFGGYTGRTPSAFVSFLTSLAGDAGLPFEHVVLGGDHLGPNSWRDEPAEVALDRSETLVEAYARAGFHKLHLDASMPCADDDVEEGEPLDDETVARRTARLCAAAERTCREDEDRNDPPVYVIGTEVPVPGGVSESEHEVEVTEVDEARRTLETIRSAFEEEGLEDAWERVVAMVVQPGVEFSDDDVIPYDPDEAQELSAFIEGEDLVFEAHSTDYQTTDALRALVRDHFAILKVGPWLTFSFREAVYALEMMEREWGTHRSDVTLSEFRSVQDDVMCEHPEHWNAYYTGSEVEQAFARKYSYSDRSRYYWSNDRIREALDQLFQNLRDHPPPPMLLSQFLPEQYRAVRNGTIENRPEELALHRIRTVLERYAQATALTSLS